MEGGLAKKENVRRRKSPGLQPNCEKLVKFHPEKYVAMGVETERVWSNFYKIDENKLKIVKSENDL